MKRILNKDYSLSLLLILVLTGLWSCSGSTGPSNSGVDYSLVSTNVQIAVDSVFSGTNYPGCIVGVWVPEQNFKIVYATGKSDLTAKKEMGTSDLFCIASCTKMYVATLVLQLYENKVLDLSEKLTNYFPTDFVDSLCIFGGVQSGSKVTLRMLLSHTSGIPDFEDSVFVMNAVAAKSKQWQPMELVRYAIANEPATNAPGTDFHYSNTNYILLGMILEKKTGKTLEELLKENIYQPLGITTAYMSDYEPGAGYKAHGYFYDNLDVTDYNMSFEWACGGIITSVEDLYIFLRGLLEEQLFKKTSTLQEMNTFNDKGYGLGLMKNTDNGINSIGHTGGALGYTSYAFYVKEKRAYIIIAVNQIAAGDIDKIYTAVWRKLPNLD